MLKEEANLEEKFFVDLMNYMHKFNTSVRKAKKSGISPNSSEFLKINESISRIINESLSLEDFIECLKTIYEIIPRIDKENFDHLFPPETVSEFVDMFINLPHSDLRYFYVTLIMQDVVYLSESKEIFHEESFISKMIEAINASGELKDAGETIFLYISFDKEWREQTDNELIYRIWSSLMNQPNKIASFCNFNINELTQNNVQNLISQGIELVMQLKEGEDIDLKDIKFLFDGLSLYVACLKCSPFIEQVSELFSSDIMEAITYFSGQEDTCYSCYSLLLLLVKKGINAEEIIDNVYPIVNDNMINGNNDNVLCSTLMFYRNCVYYRYVKFDTSFFHNITEMVENASFKVREKAVVLIADSVSVDDSFIDTFDENFSLFLLEMIHSNDMSINEKIAELIMHINEIGSGQFIYYINSEYEERESLVAALNDCVESGELSSESCIPDLIDLIEKDC